MLTVQLSAVRWLMRPYGSTGNDGQQFPDSQGEMKTLNDKNHGWLDHSYHVSWRTFDSNMILIINKGR